MTTNASSSTTNHWLNKSEKLLREAGIQTARLDALVLSEDVLGKDRSYLLAEPELTLDDNTLKLLDAKIIRRASHEPLAYIRGKAEFYGREFIINKHVLQPRPETETMIELLKEMINTKKLVAQKMVNLMDIGTGSGCLAITAKLELPQAKVIAIDIDPNCLRIARHNAKKLGAKITFRQGNLLQPIPPTAYQLPTALIANLPYVPEDYPINKAATFEPRLALFGGKDGLDYYRQLFDQISKLQIKPIYILTESIPSQHQQLESMARSASYKLRKTIDFVQCFHL